MFSVPKEKRVSYDILADPKHPQHGAELERLASIVGIPGPISPAVVPATVLPQESVNWVGEPRRWATVFSPEFIDELFRLSGEDPTAVRV
jgi:hypothetical protein